MASTDQGEEPGAVRAFGDRHGLTYPVLPDLEERVYLLFTECGLLDRIPLPRLPSLGSVPYNVVIDRNSVVRYARVRFHRPTLTPIKVERTAWSAVGRPGWPCCIWRSGSGRGRPSHAFMMRPEGPWPGSPNACDAAE